MNHQEEEGCKNERGSWNNWGKQGETGEMGGRKDRKNGLEDECDVSLRCRGDHHTDCLNCFFTLNSILLRTSADEIHRN